MSDLRDEIARAFIRREWDLGPGDDDWNPAPEELAAADAVLRVVESRLLSDEAVMLVARRMSNLGAMDGAHPENLRGGSERTLSAAWRVVTGSNHE